MTPYGVIGQYKELTLKKYCCKEKLLKKTLMSKTKTML